MKIRFIDKDSAKAVVANCKPELQEENAFWKNVEDGQKKIVEATVGKSEDMKLLESMDKLSVVYYITDIRPSEAEGIVVPLIRDLGRLFQALCVIVLDPASGKPALEPVAREKLKKHADVVHRIRQDGKYPGRILIGIFNRQMRANLDQMAFVNEVNKPAQQCERSAS